MLSVYLNRSYSHVKTVRICANTLVKGVFTSDNYYEPGRFYLPYSQKIFISTNFLVEVANITLFLYVL